MIKALAHALDVGNPIAYMFFFLILYPAVMIILWGIIESIKDLIRAIRKKKDGA